MLEQDQRNSLVKPEVLVERFLKVVRSFQEEIPKA
jgi:hypothetical protein